MGLTGEFFPKLLMVVLLRKVLFIVLSRTSSPRRVSLGSPPKGKCPQRVNWFLFSFLWQKQTNKHDKTAYKGVYFVHSWWRVIVRKTRWQECEVAGQIVSSVRKQNRKCSWAMKPKGVTHSEWSLVIHSEAPSPEGSAAPQNSTISWGASVQTTEPMWDISHSNYPEGLLTEACCKPSPPVELLRKGPSDHSVNHHPW